MTIAELASGIAAVKGVLPRPAATAAEVEATEARLGIAIPAELRQFVAVMNGSDGSTPPEESWTEFWPLERWRRVGSTGVFADYSDAIIFADYGQQSWYYAFEPARDGKVRVLKIAGPDGVMADTLGEFLAAVLRDDRKLYS